MRSDKDVDADRRDEDLALRVPNRALKLLDALGDFLERRSGVVKPILVVSIFLLAVGVGVAGDNPIPTTMIPVPMEPTPELLRFLVDDRIPHEVDDSGKLFVRRDSFDRVYHRAFASGSAEREPDFMAWIMGERVMGEMGFSETESRPDRRILHIQKRKLERTLSDLDSVRCAKIFVGDPRLPGQGSSVDVTVTLGLKGGTERLEPAVARTAANMVAAAWNVPVSRVVVTDGCGNTPDEQESLRNLVVDED